MGVIHNYSDMSEYIPSAPKSNCLLEFDEVIDAAEARRAKPGDGLFVAR
jgi:hypothetical protein